MSPPARLPPVAAECCARIEPQSAPIASEGPLQQLHDQPSLTATLHSADAAAPTHSELLSLDQHESVEAMRSQFSTGQVGQAQDSQIQAGISPPTEVAPSRQQSQRAQLPLATTSGSDAEVQSRPARPLSDQTQPTAASQSANSGAPQISVTASDSEMSDGDSDGAGLDQDGDSIMQDEHSSQESESAHGDPDPAHGNPNPARGDPPRANGDADSAHGDSGTEPGDPALANEGTDPFEGSAADAVGVREPELPEEGWMR